VSSLHQVLVVDDDEAIREWVAIILADEGYTVETAGDGDEALDRVEAKSPALILLDIRMPRMNGLEFAAAYRELPGPHAPIVVMTAGRDAQQRAREVGADGYLAKPFDLDDVVAAVSTRLGRRG
jgi:two-component system, chemotaxis family, chemotaxis protein CheY